MANGSERLLERLVGINKWLGVSVGDGRRGNITAEDSECIASDGAGRFLQVCLTRSRLWGSMTGAVSVKASGSRHTL